MSGIGSAEQRTLRLHSRTMRHRPLRHAACPLPALACVALLALLAPLHDAFGGERPAHGELAVPRECLETAPGYALRLENDLFAGLTRDADYTGGVALEWTPAEQRPDALSHRVHTRLDRALGVFRGRCRGQVWQLGLISLTPRRLHIDAVQRNDRPFASLLFVGSTAIWPGAADNVAVQSTLQVGALGLDLVRRTQAALHQVFGGDEPVGYRYQISAGGEPTARYVLARHVLVDERFFGRGSLQLKTTAAAGIGYLTEASAGVSVRFGRIDSPWETFTPEMADYLAAPVPLVAERGTSELYGVIGARLKLRAYNALLQGQFRDSPHELGTDSLQRVLAEVYAGIHWRPSGEWNVSYTLRAHTPELRNHPGRRSMIWGSIEVSQRF